MYRFYGTENGLNILQDMDTGECYTCNDSVLEIFIIRGQIVQDAWASDEWSGVDDLKLQNVT